MNDGATGEIFQIFLQKTHNVLSEKAFSKAGKQGEKKSLRPIGCVFFFFFQQNSNRSNKQRLPIRGLMWMCDKPVVSGEAGFSFLLWVAADEVLNKHMMIATSILKKNI